MTIADNEPVSSDMFEGVGEAASLAIDTEGIAHISYSDGVNRDLKYAVEDGSNFNTTTLDDSFDAVGNFTALAVDSSDGAHVAYSNTTDGSLLYIAVP